MNNNSNFAARCHVDRLQVASVTTRTGHPGVFRAIGFNLKPMAQAVLLALLGGSPLLIAAPGDCALTGSGAFNGHGGTCLGRTGNTGADDAGTGLNGGAGGEAGTGSGFDLVSSASFLGGSGGAGGAR
jgi:hypothetical protein